MAAAPGPRPQSPRSAARPRGGSSAGQSSGLIIRRSWVRAPPAPPGLTWAFCATVIIFRASWLQSWLQLALGAQPHSASLIWAAACSTSSVVTWVYRWVWLSWEWPRISWTTRMWMPWAKLVGSGRVSGVVDADPADACLVQQRQPVVPVALGVDRPAGRRAEDEIQVGPGVAGGEAFGVLGLAVGAQLGGERVRDGQDQLGGPLAGLDALAAGEAPAAAGPLRAFACVGGASLRARPRHVGAKAVAPLDAICYAVEPVPVLEAAGLAGNPVVILGAGGRILAAVPVPGSLELPADFNGPGVQVHVLPAQPDGLGLADAQRERY
jgi:hypothetical protein